MTSKTFFTSDTHFFHKNILKYSNRPFKHIDDMNYQMMEKWNETVSENDTVYLLGDVGFTTKEKLIDFLTRLNGTKHLILGNHDQVITKNFNDFAHGKVFQSISNYKEIKIDQQKIILCHYAMRVWNKSHHGSWMFFGHTHDKLSPLGKSVDVGVDSTAILTYAPYRPFSFEEIKTFMDSRQSHDKYDK